MATIKAIEPRSVHQIQSGQVIVDLCSVVKELVENSIDAGATNIEVRLKNQGLDSIEVQDNGSGISKENYETLALKHYTSKLTTYTDLTSLQTFGFRGEALSSLCALSKFTVTTCLASDAPKGSKLEYETSGKLRSTGVVAAQKGTTASVEGLFHNLPVRRRELERNIKREWNRVLGVLNQYACIQTGLKFSVSQQPNKGKRMVLFSTKGNRTTRENIVNVFGAKTLSVLIPLALELELEPTTSTPGQKWSTQEPSDGAVTQIHVRGHVSRPAHGEGRQTPDRQMFFVNGRPCGLPQFAKVFNDVYKSYNSSQSPFIFANIQLDTHLYDVNVSPDKRTILLHDQTRMLDNLRVSLSALFESQDYALPTSQLQGFKQTPFKKPSLSRQDTSASKTGSRHSTPSREDSRGKSTSAEPPPSVEGEGVHADDEDQSSGGPARKDSVTTGSLSRDAQRLNLISRWIERKSDLRTDSASRDTNKSEAPKGRSRAEEPVSKCGPDNTEESENSTPMEVPDDLSASAAEATETSSRIADFRTRLQGLSQSKTHQTTGIAASAGQDTSEPPIPFITTPSRVSDVKTSKAAPYLPMKRSAPEVATITIGDHTVTSIIGSPSKKQRVEHHPAQHSSAQRTAKQTVPVPSFNGRLTQMFAANTQSSQTVSRQIEVTSEMRDVSEHSDSSSEHLFVSDEEEEKGSQSEDGEEVEVDHQADDDDEDEHDQQHEVDEVVEKSPGKEDCLDTRNSSPVSDENSELPQKSVSLSPTHLSDEDYVDDVPRKAGDAEDEEDEEETRGIVATVEEPADTISEETQKRTQSFVKGGTKKKNATCHLQQTLRTDETHMRGALTRHRDYLGVLSSVKGSELVTDKLDAEDAEEKLSLTISKSDFGKMKIIGQFNLGFILASRPGGVDIDEDQIRHTRDDELFIIDQHATDEKYNFERLQANTVVQSQRLVQPKTLELTAVEEDIVQENLEALETNGFMVSFDDSGDEPFGTRCQLLSLPLSRETTFNLPDLEELISLLRDHQSISANTVPRPSKVRKMFAMRACRSSVMIGKSLTNQQMEKLVRHMGELDKPWNCPHGRPTMRHLCGLGAWDEMGWKEGDGLDGERALPTNWGAYVRDQNEIEWRGYL
ncbi:Uu.00g018780.m01.CDS01 [Anthostomella pinea]|uniref:DNA mismatch repair protein PMS1 n=1 Tax=Anthostomella pinea TaxID=933095 RepID=A0AAI8YQK7_9PEZI|nr:Uu.00g018780.m01.CDS01 [Anthostomella pinea]